MIRFRSTLLLTCLIVTPLFAGSSYEMDKDPGDIPADLIRKTPVPASSIQTMEYRGNSIEVTHDVPERFFGTYEYSVERAPFPEYAKRFILEPDGTGLQSDYACSDCEDPDDRFEWGLVVEKDHLLVGEYTISDADASGDITRERYRGHKIIFRYTDSDDEGFGHNVLYNDDGRLSLIGPHDQPAYRK